MRSPELWPHSILELSSKGHLSPWAGAVLPRVPIGMYRSRGLAEDIYMQGWDSGTSCLHCHSWHRPLMSLEGLSLASWIWKEQRGTGSGRTPHTTALRTSRQFLQKSEARQTDGSAVGQEVPASNSPVPSPGFQELRPRAKGGGRVSAGQAGLEPRASFPSPSSRNRGHLFGYWRLALSSVKGEWSGEEALENERDSLLPSGRGLGRHHCCASALGPCSTAPSSRTRGRIHTGLTLALAIVLGTKPGLSSHPSDVERWL